MQASTTYEFYRIKQISENYKTKNQDKLQKMVKQSQINIVKYTARALE